MKPPCTGYLPPMQHSVSGCKKLAQEEYKRRHDNVAKKVHWDLFKKDGLEYTQKMV